MSDWYDYDPEDYPKWGKLMKDTLGSDNKWFFEIIENMATVQEEDFDFLGVEGEIIDLMLKSKIALRTPSPVVVSIHNEESDVVTRTEKDRIAYTMWKFYRHKWKKLREICLTSYDPIHNYLDEWEDSDITERTINDRGGAVHERVLSRVIEDKDRQKEIRFGKGLERSYDNYSEVVENDLNGNNIRTDNLTENNSGSNGTKEHMRQGVNSSTYQPESKDVETGYGANSKTNTGTQRNDYEDNGTVTKSFNGSYSDDESGTETETLSGKTEDTTTITEQVKSGMDVKEDNYTKDRGGFHRGNIGNLTSQKMIREEIDLWQWGFIDEILNDATKFLCLQVWL